MKKQLLFPIVALLFLFACKQEAKKEIQGEIAGLWKLYKTNVGPWSGETDPGS